MTSTMLLTARAEALFLSGLQPSESPTATEVNHAISTVIRAHRGVRGCACDVAAEFGDHPHEASTRMRWALSTVRTLYPVRPRPCTGLRLGSAFLVGAMQ